MWITRELKIHLSSLNYRHYSVQFTCASRHCSYPSRLPQDIQLLYLVSLAQNIVTMSAVENAASVAPSEDLQSLSTKDVVLETGASAAQVRPVMPEALSRKNGFNDMLVVIRSGQANMRTSQRVPRIRIRLETLCRSKPLLFAHIKRSDSQTTWPS